MTVVTLLVLSFDDHVVVDGLHGDFRWLEVMHVDTRLEAIFAKVHALAVLLELIRQATSEREWTSVAGWQMVKVARTRQNSVVKVAWEETQTETWLHACREMR